MWNVIGILFANRYLKNELSRISIEELIFFLFTSNMLVGGKSFSYVGFSPLYITDLCIVCILCIILNKHVLRGKIAVFKSIWPYIIIFCLLYANALRVLVLDVQKGIDAFRDSAIVFYSIWLFIAVYIFRKKNNWKILSILFCAVAVYSATRYVYSIGEFLVLKKLPGFEGFRFGAGYITPSIFVVFAFCFFDKINKKVSVILMILSMAILTLFHRSIYLGTLMSVITLMFCLRGYKANRIFKLSSLGVALSMLMVFGVYLSLGIETDSVRRYVKAKATGNDGNVSYRTESWRIGLEKLSENPFLGYGVGEPLVYIRKDNTFYRHTKMNYFEIRDIGGSFQVHNSPITFFVRYGIIGGFLFLFVHFLLIFNLFKKLHKNRELVGFSLASIVYMFVYSCFNVVLEGPHDGSIYWIIFGLAISVSIYHYNWNQEFFRENYTSTQ